MPAIVRKFPFFSYLMMIELYVNIDISTSKESSIGKTLLTKVEIVFYSTFLIQIKHEKECLQNTVQFRGLEQ